MFGIQHKTIKHNKEKNGGVVATLAVELPIQEILLGRMNAFCLIGRYPGNLDSQQIPVESVKQYQQEALEVMLWLRNKLSEQ